MIHGYYILISVLYIYIYIYIYQLIYIHYNTHFIMNGLFIIYNSGMKKIHHSILYMARGGGGVGGTWIPTYFLICQKLYIKLTFVTY